MRRVRLIDPLVLRAMKESGVSFRSDAVAGSTE